MIKRFSNHNHTDRSNFRLIDSINKLPDLVQYGYDIGLAGLAITDHETISQSIQVCNIREKYPDFKIAMGNEIYLVDKREMGIPYYHFILIAKDEIGHRQLRELSSRAWMQSYWDRGLERVPTTKEELIRVVGQNPGHLIATSACIGGELSSSVLKMEKARKIKSAEQAKIAYVQIKNFMSVMLRLFKDDFYIECAPGASSDQIIVNKKLVEIANVYNCKMVIGDDAHYLKKEDSYIHEAYLNSKEGEREVRSFYEYAYLHTEQECIEDLTPSIVDMYETMCNNSIEMMEKIKDFDLRSPQQIPKVTVKNYPKKKKEIKDCPIISQMYESDDIYNRYWINQCEEGLIKKHLENKPEYWKRLEEEANTKTIIGKKLNTNMFLYPITLQHYVDLFWECDSLVGAGRGSACSGLNHYLLGVTQMDPIVWGFPFWRYLNPDREELGDIDLDLAPSKRPLILQKIKAERGANFKEELDDLTKKNLGCTLIATYGTEKTKSAVLTACRGYRSEQYPQGIDVDTAQYIASLIPQERGFLWTLKEVLYGNPDKGRKPVTSFINAIEAYPGLVNIMLGIEGLCNKRSSHASGVIFFDEDPYEHGCFMKTPKGEIITQYDLHEAESASMTKYDFLVTEIEDKLGQAIKLLQKYGKIEQGTLREVYDKYFHPDVLDLENEEVWKNIRKNEILSFFQFDSAIGGQAIKKVQPKNIWELIDCNGLMRLMPDEGETPMDKYVRYKQNIDLWYKEMDKYGLTKDEQKTLEPYFKNSYGVPPSQEQMMLILMDKNICGFSLKDANTARKIVGKKQMSKIPLLKEQVLSTAKSERLGQYIWRFGLGPQMGYSFSLIHAGAYSTIGYQTAYIATLWNPIYWNTACLIVNSGSLEEAEAEDDDLEATEKGTDYAKLAKALGEIISQKVKISLIDINESDYMFIPDEENNQILFGMKALTGVNNNVIELIMKNRPYHNIKEFLSKVKLNKKAMNSLIKAGAFDKICQEEAEKLGRHPRIVAMAYYLSISCKPKTKLNLQNFSSLMTQGILPKDLTEQINAFKANRIFRKNKIGDKYYSTNESGIKYLERYGIEAKDYVNNRYYILQKDWDVIYQNLMDSAREWIKEHQEEALFKLNLNLFQQEWNKYATGNLSSWEMESLCFYYHNHELIKLDTNKYGISDFNQLSETPIVETVFKKGDIQIPLYELTRIAGTVISKNDVRSSIFLLTTTGVVNVKFTKDYYAMFKRQISQPQSDGTKKVIEKGWFTRGTKLIVNGFRRDDTFVAKKYARTGGHQLYKILSINDDGEVEITNERQQI